MREVAQRGGRATLKKYGKEYLRALASKAGKASKLARDKAKLEKLGGVDKSVDSTDRLV